MTSKPSLLYIEDDRLSRNMLKKVLDFEFEVVTAQNGFDGLAILQRKAPDIVVTDLNLPDLNGEIIAARIRALVGPKLPIVALTGMTDTALRHRALVAGCNGFLTKPIETSSIAKVLKDYMNGARRDQLTDAQYLHAMVQFKDNLVAQLESTSRAFQHDNAELRVLDKAKTAFLTQVSHELRTPLTVLSGYVQMLNRMLHEDAQINDQHRELSDMTLDSLRRLHSLMNEIVVMARLASNELDAFKAPLRVEVTALDVIQEYTQAMLDRHIVFQTAGEGWRTTILADSTLIRMLFSNLLSNAIKYTPDYGKIILRIDGEGDKLHIIFKDTGVGISPDDKELLFKPFFTSADVNRGRTSKTSFMGMGMGIGLTIVTKVVEAHNGQIWVDSPGYDEKNCPGSEFHVLLPITVFS